MFKTKIKSATHPPNDKELPFQEACCRVSIKQVPKRSTCRDLSQWGGRGIQMGIGRLSRKEN